MGDIIPLPVHSDPRKQAQHLMELARKELRDPRRRTLLFEEATELLRTLKPTAGDNPK